MFFKSKSKVTTPEPDYIITNSSPNRFVAKVYSDLGAGQIIEYLGNHRDITNVTIQNPPLSDAKQSTVSIVGFTSIVDGVVLCQNITHFKFSGFNLSEIAVDLCSHFIGSTTLTNIGFWRSSLNDMAAYTIVCDFLFIF